MRTFYVPIRLTTGLDDHLARRFLAGRIGGREREREFGVVSALGSGRVVRRSRTQTLDVLPRKPEG